MQQLPTITPPAADPRRMPLDSVSSASTDSVSSASTDSVSSASTDSVSSASTDSVSYASTRFHRFGRRSPRKGLGWGGILVLIALLTTSLPGCSVLGLGGESENKTPQTETGKVGAASDNGSTAVPVEKLETKKDTPPTGTAIELVWEIPKDPVDGFIIHYGYSRDSLPNELKLTAADIQRVDDPNHGSVYRHVIENVPAEKSVFVSIAAFKGDQVSAPSEVFEINSTGS